MKPLFFLAVCLASGFAMAQPVQTATEKPKAPEGVLYAGSAANPRLQMDVMPDVLARAVQRGCAHPMDVKPHVMALPSGDHGERVWKETWVVVCRGGAPAPVAIEFKESKTDAVKWSFP